VSSGDRRRSNVRVFRTETMSELEYSVLTAEQRDATLIVISRAFCSLPFSVALPGTRALTDNILALDSQIDHCVSLNLSMIAVDTQRNRVAGGCLLRDHKWRPQSREYIELWVQNRQRPTAAVTNAVQHIDQLASSKFPLLDNCREGEIVDIWCLGVHPDYRGRRIASSLFSKVLPIAKSAGYRYAVIECISAHTSRIAEKLGFNLLVRYDAKSEFRWEGELVFANVEPPHGNMDVWILELNP
jgi:ribosomal protein S18 acetylase RimI-like enzyme